MMNLDLEEEWSLCCEIKNRGRLEAFFGLLGTKGDSRRFGA